MLQKLKHKKIHITLMFGAVAAGLLLYQGVVQKEAREPKIDFLSPNQGLAGTQVIISGSGFTISVQGIVGTKVKEKVYAPGNYILIKDEVFNQPMLSPDGKTLTVRIDLISDKIRRECEDKFSKKKPEPCKVPIKVVNAYGKPSNDVLFTITGRQIKKLTYTIEKLDMPAPAVIHAIVPGEAWSGDEVMRIRISAPATNEQTISDIQLVIAPDTGTFGGTPVPCSYFYAMNPDPLIGEYIAMGGAWMTSIDNPDESFNGAGPLGLDMGMFSGPRYAPTIGCPIWVSGTDIAPGAHKDVSIHMKMYAQNYTLKADGTYTSPAEQSRMFNLLARAFTFYGSPGYYVVDNSPDNGYISADAYPGDGGAAFNMSLSKLITSDPIKIIPQAIPIPYTITATQGANGTISPGMTSVRSGDSQRFIITPATGYQVANVSVDGINQGPISTYTFTNVTSAHSIKATFSPVSTQSCSLTVSIAQTTPAAQTISPGQTGVTLVKFNATPNCDGTLKSFAVSLLPTPNGYQNISSLRLYDDVSGVQLGTTQSVTAAGMNFDSVNIPLTTNQALVLRVVGDVSPSASIRSTVYGVFGGSSGFTDSGVLIGNNASGNLISGNTMTIR